MPLKEVHETLPARIHHPVTGQHLQLPRWWSQGGASCRQRPVKHYSKIIRFEGMGGEVHGPSAQHGENGAFPRVLQGLVGCLHAPVRRSRELTGTNLCLSHHTSGQTVQELGEDSAGVATRSVQSGVRRQSCGSADLGGEGLPKREPAAASVAARLAPVSASATGNTLMRSSTRCSRCTVSAPASTA